MKLILTIVKQSGENKQIIGTSVEEKVAENVHFFMVDDGKQELFIHYNDGTEETIQLQTQEGEKWENWILADIKCIEIPLRVKL